MDYCLLSGALLLKTDDAPESNSSQEAHDDVQSGKSWNWSVGLSPTAEVEERHSPFVRG